MLKTKRKAAQARRRREFDFTEPLEKTPVRHVPQLNQRLIDFDAPQPEKICRLFVDCPGEADQARLAKWLRAKGYEVREITI